MLGRIEDILLSDKARKEAVKKWFDDKIHIQTKDNADWVAQSVRSISYKINTKGPWSAPERFITDFITALDQKNGFEVVNNTEPWK